MAIGLSASYKPAQSAETGPLTNLPLLYDATGKLIGPYYRDITYIRFEGRTFQTRVGLNDFYQNKPGFAYESKDCSGEAYLFSFMTPIMYVYKDEIYYHAAEVSRRGMGSYRFSSSPTGACSVSGGTDFFDVAKAITGRREALGVTFPLQAGPPR